MPPSFEPAWSLLEAFQDKYPQVQIQTLALSRAVDIAVQFGQTTNLSLVSRVMAANKRKLVASKAFVAQYGTPKTPHDLLHFSCLAWDNPATEVTWQLGNEEVTFAPYSMSNEFSLLKYMTLNGRGIALLPPFFCKDEIASGDFIHLLPEHPAPESIVPITYPSRKQLSLVTRTFIDFSAEFILEHENDTWSLPNAVR